MVGDVGFLVMWGVLRVGVRHPTAPCVWFLWRRANLFFLLDPLWRATARLVGFAGTVLRPSQREHVRRWR